MPALTNNICNELLYLNVLTISYVEYRLYINITILYYKHYWFAVSKTIYPGMEHVQQGLAVHFQW
jgi:hypothetical protein